jgi:hypothetical protein
MAVSILIAGAGQLGSRYLQGLSSYAKPLRIWVYDTSVDSLDRAKLRWLECDRQPHPVVYTKNLATIPPELDIAIVATNADARVKVVEKISHIASVRYWVLEKILAQRVPDLHALVRATAVSDGVWVNTPMYLWPLYRAIREQSPGDRPIQAYFVGFRGLACNSIHYIDFVSRWNLASISSIETAALGGQWVSSKRAGFYEVEGELSLKFSDGSTLVVAGGEQSTGYEVKIHANDDVWQVCESKGFASTGNGKIINAPILRQTELTAPLLDEILTRGSCDLPTLAVSINQHEPLLKALLDHWNTNMPNPLDHAPIT